MKVPSNSKNNRSKIVKNTDSERNSQNQNRQPSKSSVETEKVCAACLFQISTLAEDHCLTECTHHYHEQCLVEWLKQKNTCCLCREKMKKYICNSKGQIIVPNRPQRLSLLDFLISFENPTNLSDSGEFFLLNSVNLNTSMFLTSNNNDLRRNHFIFSFDSLFQDNENPIIIDSSPEQEMGSQLPALQTLQQIQVNPIQINSVVTPHTNQSRIRKIRKSRTKKNAEKRVTRSSSRKIESVNTIQRLRTNSRVHSKNSQVQVENKRR